MNNEFRVVHTEPLLESYVFDVERRTVSQGGSTFARDVVTHRGAVAVLAVDDNGLIGLIRQYRAPFDRYVLEIPAGTLDVPDEQPRDAAQRELLEELGCEATSWTLLGRFMVSPGWTDQVMIIYEARGLSVGTRSPEGPEESSSEVLWRSADELRAELQAEGVADSTLVLALHRVFGTFFDLA